MDFRRSFGGPIFASQEACPRMVPAFSGGLLVATGEPIEQRKARGAFFTPPEITDFVVQWAIRSNTDRVLEPSCGEGEFLVPSGRRLMALGAGLFAGQALTAVEIHRPSARIAQERVREVGLDPEFLDGDFFSFPASGDYDAVVGNPPYIRYQDFSGEARRIALERALEHGVRLTGLASSWAAFLIHASGFLNPEGRLGLVVPAELLAVKYAAEVRRFLLRRFRRVRLVVFEELIFPGVQEEVLLLLAEGTGPSDHFEVFQARDLSDLPSLDGHTWHTYSPVEDGKWIPALLPNKPLETYQSVSSASGFENLLSWGHTYLGAVTGNNRFFALSPSNVKALGLSEEDLLRISPPGSRHLRGLAFQESYWKALGKEGRRVYLFRPEGTGLSKAAREYIEAGEALGVHTGYKCRTRAPWWRVPVVDVPDIFFTYMDRDRPRLVTNRASAYHVNSLYGIRLRPGRIRLGKDLLPLAALNSVTLLGSEMVGRAYGGGLLKLEPNEADRLPVPSYALLREMSEPLRAIRPQLSVALRGGDLTECVRLVDRVVLSTGLGLPFGQVRDLREARQVLFKRRMVRSRARAD